MTSRLTDLNRERWSAAESDWRGYFRGEGGVEFDARVKATLKMLPGSAESLLDVGASDGVLTRAFAQKSGASLVAGVDVAHLAAARGEGVAAVSFDLNAGLALPFADESFDVVVCGGTLEHVLDTDAVLSEMRRVLAPGGTLIVSVPRIDSLLSTLLLALGFQPPSIECSLEERFGTVNSGSQVSGHVSHFTRRALLEMLGRRGFKVKKVKCVGIYSSWLLAQKAAGRKAGVSRLLLRLLDLIPFKRDVLVVSAVKS